MPKIDRLDRLIRDYVNGNIDKRIEARIEQLTYKSKIDNLGIRMEILNNYVQYY